MELVGREDGSALAGSGGVSPSVVVSSSLLGSVICLEIEGNLRSSSVVASSSLSRFMTSLDFGDLEPCSWSESMMARFKSSSSEENSMTGAGSAVRA